MAKEPNYFGVKIGEALAAGAGHIAGGLEKRYEAQRRREEIDRMMEERMRQEQTAPMLEAAKAGYDFSPAGFQKFVSDQQRRRDMEMQTEAAKAEMYRARATGGGAGQRPPTGFRYTPEGNMEAIPGGPAALKIQEAQAKKEQGISTNLNATINNIATADEALNMVSGWTTGAFGNIAKSLGGTEAANLEAKLNTLKANLGFDRLSQMRAESPTGGALGQVSERELELLTSAMASLSQKQTPKQLKESLTKVRTHLANWKANLEKAKEQGMLKPSVSFAPEELGTGQNITVESVSSEFGF